MIARLVTLLLCVMLAACSTFSADRKAQEPAALAKLLPIEHVTWDKVETPPKPRIDLLDDLSDKSKVATLSEQAVRRTIGLYEAASDRTNDVNRLVDVTNTVIDERNALLGTAQSMEVDLNQCRIDYNELATQYEKDLYWADVSSMFMQVLIAVGAVALLL